MGALSLPHPQILKICKKTGIFGFSRKYAWAFLNDTYVSPGGIWVDNRSLKDFGEIAFLRVLAVVVIVKNRQNHGFWWKNRSKSFKISRNQCKIGGFSA